MDTSVPGQPVATLDLDLPGFPTQQVRLKGVCYSPAPIGGSSNFTPNIGETGSALKPVIITEWGMPATTHAASVDRRTIEADPGTIHNTAQCIDLMVPKIFAEKLCLGLFYFEYCDEWWKQNITFYAIRTLGGGYAGWVDKIQPPELRKDDSLFDAVYIHWGGPPNPDFPNGYSDEAGFGLYSVRRGQGIPLINDPYGPRKGNSIGPALPIDTHFARAEMIEVLTKCYAAVKR